MVCYESKWAHVSLYIDYLNECLSNEIHLFYQKEEIHMSTCKELSNSKYMYLNISALWGGEV